MTDILNTGKSALFAFQRALATTSHNIANVNTDGYTRQRVNLEAVPGDVNSDWSAGSGVRVTNIQRLSNQFANSRVNSATSAYSQQETHHQMASRLDNLVASEGMSIGPVLTEFFNTLQDVNIDPSSTATREVFIDSTEQLANRFRSLQAQLDDAQNEVNIRTVEAVKTVDNYAQSIASINNRLVEMQGSVNAQASNDLLDQRDKLLKDLSEFIEVDAVEQDNGSINVFIGKGIGLVVNGAAQRLETVRDDTHPDRLNIQIGEDNTIHVVRADLQGGVIGGLNEFVTDTLHPAMQELGHLALKIADKVNEQHTRGLDTNGDPGGDIFGSADPQVFSSTKNTGTGVLTGRIQDVSSIVAADYEISFDGASYTATRSTDGVSTTGSIPMTVDGIQLTLTGAPVAGDTFVVSATGRAAGSMTAELGDPDKLALSGQLDTNSSIDNIGDARISNASVLDPEAISLSTPIDIVFTDDTTYDLVDAGSGSTISSGLSYQDGGTIALNGWEVSITGSARSGDTHRIEPNTTGRGNNSNGLALADMQSEMIIGGTQTFNDAYGSLVSRVGSQTHSAKSQATALLALKDNAIDRQQSMQGVSLDEEAIDLTRFQQAYQASAQIISVADKLFQTILGAVR